jgi:hypothetical protein
VSETVSKPVEVSVVLQGGGALGAYDCGALLELINYLAVKIAPDDRSDWLNARFDEARLYKIIDAIVNIDMPSRSSGPRRIRLTTRMACAISRRRPCATGTGTDSDLRTTSCSRHS